MLYKYFVNPNKTRMNMAQIKKSLKIISMDMLSIPFEQIGCC